MKFVLVVLVFIVIAGRRGVRKKRRRLEKDQVSNFRDQPNRI